MLERKFFQARVSSDRERILDRLSSFINLIAVDLLQHGLALQGSWSNGEFHATEVNQFIYSLSDIDFICEKQLSLFEKSNVEMKISKIAANCKLYLQQISIRLQSDMRDMWVIQCNEYNDIEYRQIHSEFIQFWALISAAEVCRALSKNYSQYKHDYYLNKFFLLMWKDISIIEGHHLNSYSETIGFTLQNLSSEIRCASYALKLGEKPSVSWNRIQPVYESLFMSKLINIMQNSREYSLMIFIIDSLKNINYGSTQPLALEMLKYARRLNRNLSSRESVCNRLFRKLKS